MAKTPRQAAADLADSIKAEEATGIRQSTGDLLYYHKTQPDTPLTIPQAKAFIEDGETIECPGAGAGTLRQVAQDLELGPVECYDNSSSAGDWDYRLTARVGWFIQQTNRYPRFGFGYALFEDHVAWDSCEDPDDE